MGWENAQESPIHPFGQWWKKTVSHQPETDPTHPSAHQWFASSSDFWRIIRPITVRSQDLHSWTVKLLKLSPDVPTSGIPRVQGTMGTTLWYPVVPCAISWEKDGKNFSCETTSIHFDWISHVLPNFVENFRWCLILLNGVEFPPKDIGLKRSQETSSSVTILSIFCCQSDSRTVHWPQTGQFCPLATALLWLGPTLVHVKLHVVFLVIYVVRIYLWTPGRLPLWLFLNWGRVLCFSSRSSLRNSLGWGTRKVLVCTRLFWFFLRPHPGNHLAQSLNRTGRCGEKLCEFGGPYRYSFRGQKNSACTLQCIIVYPVPMGSWCYSNM